MFGATSNQGPLLFLGHRGWGCYICHICTTYIFRNGVGRGESVQSDNAPICMISQASASLYAFQAKYDFYFYVHHWYIPVSFAPPTIPVDAASTVIVLVEVDLIVTVSFTVVVASVSASSPPAPCAAAVGIRDTTGVLG